jgi:hypothetical protein
VYIAVRWEYPKHPGGTAVKLIKVAGGGGDGCTDGDTCPAKYRTDRRTTVYIGRPVTDPEALAELAPHVGAGEAVFEVPDHIADAL